MNTIEFEHRCTIEFKKADDLYEMCNWCAQHISQSPNVWNVVPFANAVIFEFAEEKYLTLFSLRWE